MFSRAAPPSRDPPLTYDGVSWHHPRQPLHWHVLCYISSTHQLSPFEADVLAHGVLKAFDSTFKARFRYWFYSMLSIICIFSQLVIPRHSGYQHLLCCPALGLTVHSSLSRHISFNASSLLNASLDRPPQHLPLQLSCSQNMPKDLRLSPYWWTHRLLSTSAQMTLFIQHLTREFLSSTSISTNISWSRHFAHSQSLLHRGDSYMTRSCPHLI